MEVRWCNMIIKYYTNLVYYKCQVYLLSGVMSLIALQNAEISSVKRNFQ